MPDRTTPSYRSTLRELRPALLAVGGLSALANLLMLTGPLYMLQVYDRVLTSGSVATMQGLFVIVLVMFGFLGLFDFLRSRILSRAGHRLDALLGERAFRLWLRQPATAGGDAASAGQGLRDVDTLRGVLAGPAMLGLFDLPWIPIYVAVLFLVHPLLGWLTLAGAAVVCATALLNHWLTGAGMAVAGGLEGQERGFVERSQRNAELIAALGMAGRVAGQWRQMHDRRLATAQAGSERSEGFSAFSKTFRMFLQSAMLTLAAWLVLGQELSAGMIIAASVISGRALAPVDQIIGQWRQIGRARAAHRRLLDSLGEEAAPTRAKLPAPTGRLRVSGISKLAPGQGPLSARARILDRVGFELASGDGLGVIGPSASGKSTLARVLIGAWTAETGEIRFDGATPDQWDPELLGRHLGYLPQVVELLPGTIRDNIARFDPWAEDAHVFEAARIAGVHEMILALPQGYATRAGADCPLSGGQIQRLGLARAIFGLPRIVVLDEPNANLDQEGDEALRRAILTLRERGSTVIVMAHRPSAIAAVNKVMVLQGGRVAQFGLREEVLGPVDLSARGPVAVPVAVPVAGSEAVAVAAPATGPVAEPATGPAVSAARGLRPAPLRSRPPAEAGPPAPPLAPVSATPLRSVSDRVEAVLRAARGAGSAEATATGTETGMAANDMPLFSGRQQGRSA